MPEPPIARTRTLTRHLTPGTRSYATEAKLPSRPAAAASRPTRFRRPLLSLDHFLERQKALGLWRDIVRSTNKIRVAETRDEMRRYARGEFERNRTVADLTQIRYLVSTGREQFRQMGRYVDEMGRRG